VRQLSAQLAHEHRRIPDAKRRSLALSRLQTSVVNSLDQYTPGEPFLWNRALQEPGTEFTSWKNLDSVFCCAGVARSRNDGSSPRNDAIPACFMVQ
jgi:hypothetical protein